MPSGIRLFGFAQAQGQLRNMRGQFAEAGRSRAFMGTVAPYAGFVNDGTSRMAPRQFMEKGRRRAAAGVRNNAADAQKVWDVAAEEGEKAALELALSWRRETKAVIREEDIWESGNLHQSMAAAATEAELAVLSRRQSIR